MLGVLLSLAVYLTQAVAGLLVVHALRDDDPESGWRRGPGLWARVLLLGPGALTLQMLLYDAVGLRFHLAAVLLPWWVLAACVLRPDRGARPLARGPWYAAMVTAAAAIVAASFAATGITPVHSGDAIHNFLVIGKLFAQEQSLAPRALLSFVDPAHNEYPPLVATNEALWFLCDPDRAYWAVRPFFGLAHLALALLVVEALWHAHAPRVSALLCALCIAAPEVCLRSGVGTPDLRLTATVLLLGMQGAALVRQRGHGMLRFAAVAGLCGFTKNEGIAISGAGFVFLLVHAVRVRADARSVVAALLFIGTFVSTWPLYRENHGIREQFLGDAAASIDVARAWVRLPGIALEWARLMWGALPDGVPRWGALWALAPLLGALALRGPARGLALGAGLALAAHLALYTATFAVTADNVRWHMATAADRLLIHTSGWPVLLLAAWLRGLRPTAADGR